MSPPPCLASSTTVELLANGESTDGIWDRFEWTRDADGAWSEPRRLMPY